MVLRIYKPTKTAMQSGRSKTKSWIAEYISSESLEKDSLIVHSEDFLKADVNWLDYTIK